MEDRFKTMRKYLGKTQTALAKELDMTQNYIALIETGKRIPSDRTIADISRMYGISAEWLQNGIGDMLVKKDKYAEIAEYVAGLSKKPPNDFQIRLMSVLARLPEEQWEVLAQIAKDLEEQA